MAQELQVGTTRVKIRNPFGVFVLSMVTFGIYYVVWYYKVNRELRDAAGIDVSPIVAAMAISIGWCIVIPPFVSWYRTFERIRRAQKQAGTSEVSSVLGFILFLVAVVFLPVEVLYAQDELNKLWRARTSPSA